MTGAQKAYNSVLADSLVEAAPEAHQRIQAGFTAAEEALAANDGPALALGAGADMDGIAGRQLSTG